MTFRDAICRYYFCKISAWISYLVCFIVTYALLVYANIFSAMIRESLQFYDVIVPMNFLLSIMLCSQTCQIFVSLCQDEIRKMTQVINQIIFKLNKRKKLGKNKVPIFWLSDLLKLLKETKCIGIIYTLKRWKSYRKSFYTWGLQIIYVYLKCNKVIRPILNYEILRW